MTWIRHFLPFITRAHRFVYLASGGWIGGWLFGMRFLLLGTVGRRSGNHYLTPILYVPDGERFILAGSNAGQDRHPAWWLNLQARPDATVQAGRRRLAVKARRASSGEAERLGTLLQGSHPWLDSYREATDREIPLVVLEPTEGRRRPLSPGPTTFELIHLDSFPFSTGTNVHSRDTRTDSATCSAGSRPPLRIGR